MHGKLHSFIDQRMQEECSGIPDCFEVSLVKKERAHIPSEKVHKQAVIDIPNANPNSSQPDPIPPFVMGVGGKALWAKGANTITEIDSLNRKMRIFDVFPTFNHCRNINPNFMTFFIRAENILCKNA